MLPEEYATQEDLAAYWRPLSTAEQSRATVLLGAAADYINEQPDAKDFVQTACHWVSLDMVKRAMLSRGDGVSNVDQAMADMSAHLTYVNPVGNLYLTPQERARLAGRTGGNAFSLALTSNTRVPPYPWDFQNSSQTNPPPPTPTP